MADDLKDQSSPSLFDYFDYREYLHDYYLFHKKKNSAYSYRLFARKAKLGSPNYLKLVVDGKRRITDRTLFQFARGLGLSRDEEKYFRELVMYQEVSDPDSKELHLRSLLKYQEKQRTPTPLKADKIKFLLDWHHAVIRELVASKDFKEDPAWIAKRLGNKITEAQAKESLDLLIRFRFCIAALAASWSSVSHYSLVPMRSPRTSSVVCTARICGRRLTQFSQCQWSDESYQGWCFRFRIIVSRKLKKRSKNFEKS